MVRSAITSKRNPQHRAKVKTGCTTCRIRKVKCDENKPFCRKCISTGRKCDGFESQFRIFTTQSMKSACAVDTKRDVGPKPVWPSLTEVTHGDVDLLNHYFSTKTMFNVRLSCDEDARQILQASLTDPSIRHAVLSLGALRENFEICGDDTTPPPTLRYDYGLHQYCMALGGLASNLSSLSSNALKSALLCCQIFISIEQVRWNLADMAQHIIRGLKIMHEYRTRPYLVAAHKLEPANHDQLPLLDVFIIKLFAAPCKFADPPATINGSGTALLGVMKSPRSQHIESRDLRLIAPDMRAKLVRIGESTIDLLGRVSQVESFEKALQLLSDKMALLHSLDSWLTDLELVQRKVGLPGDPEPITEGFMRFFHQTLRVILLGVLESSPELDAELQTANERLQRIANHVGERVKAYRTCNGNRSGRGRRPKTH